MERTSETAGRYSSAIPPAVLEALNCVISAPAALSFDPASISGEALDSRPLWVAAFTDIFDVSWANKQFS